MLLRMTVGKSHGGCGESVPVAIPIYCRVMMSIQLLHYFPVPLNFWSILFCCYELKLFLKQFGTVFAVLESEKFKTK